MKSTILNTLVLTSLIITGCAKERSTEKVTRIDILQKSDLTGSLKDKNSFSKPDLLKAFKTNNESGARINSLNESGVHKLWFGKVTVVKTGGSSSGAGKFIGLQSDMKMGAFRFTQKNLEFFNVITPGTRPSENIPSSIVSWDIEHKDFRLAESDGKVSNKEVEDDKKLWYKKRSFEIDWSGMTNNDNGFFPISSALEQSSKCFEEISANVVPEEVEITTDSLNFTVERHYALNIFCAGLREFATSDFNFSVQMKYSFRAVTAEDLVGYEPYNYNTDASKNKFDRLHRKYGYFQTLRRGTNSEGLDDATILMNRWHPDKEHTFYFSADFPEKYKWMFKDPKIGIETKTNELFRRNGLKIRFHIKDNDGTKKFGDIRYSFVKFNTTLDSGAPLGYGPSDANPLTGELVSANLMMWTGLMEHYVRRIADEVAIEPTRFDQSTLFKEMAELFNSVKIEEQNEAKWLDTAQALSREKTAGQAFDLLLKRQTFPLPNWATFSTAQSSGQNFVEKRLSGNLPYNQELLNLTDVEALDPFISHEAKRSIGKTLNKLHGHARRHLFELSSLARNSKLSTIYEVDQTLSDAMGMIIDGKNPEQVIDTLLYRVAIHEFGHNLNLRHNFYGSVDVKNFNAPHPAYDRHGQPIMRQRPDGSKVHALTEPKSSSVMEYLSLRDELHSEWNWEPYDEAALVYAYSAKGGQAKDLSEIKNTRYLFCTDDHSPLNAMCNTWDNGSTPSEVVMSMIKTYDARYITQNTRYGRTYWDTSGYESRMFGTMWDLKRFLMMWLTAFGNTDLSAMLSEAKDLNLDQFQIRSITRDIQKDLIRANRLVVSFYNAVIQQSSSQRHYIDDFDTETGELTRKGIISDKIYAMMFLMGDEGFLYNIDATRRSSYASFLSVSGVPGLSDVMDEVLKNTVTVRPAMEPWFIGYGRGLYAMNSFNYNNMGNAQLINKIASKCYTAEGLKYYIGIDPLNYSPANSDITRKILVELHPTDDKVIDPDYSNSNEQKLGIAKVGTEYYVASEGQNPYSYKIFQDMSQRANDPERSLVTSQMDLKELRRLYYMVQNEVLAPECIDAPAN